MKFVKLIEDNISSKQVKPDKKKIQSNIISWMSPTARENLKNHLEFIKKTTHNK